MSKMGTYILDLQTESENQLKTKQIIMDYEKAYRDLKIEIEGTAGGYRNFLENNQDVEFTQTYQDAIAQVETLEKLEEFINKQNK